MDEKMVRLATVQCSTGDIVLDLDESDSWDEPMVLIHQPRFHGAPYMASISAEVVLKAADAIRRHRYRAKMKAAGGPFPSTCCCGMPAEDSNLSPYCTECLRAREKSS